MKLKKIISALLVLTVIMTSIPVASTMNAFAAAQPTKAFKGVDVSRWNGEIDWNVMKSRGVDFVIMRCYSYGIDKKFIEYYDGATAAGLDVGAYIFMYATTQKEAVSEAQACLKALDGRELTYPLFLDIEYEKLKTFSRTFLTDLCITELEIYKKAGYDVGIYCSKSFQATYLDMPRFSPYYIWTAKWSLWSTENDNKKFYFSDMDPYDSSRAVGDLWQFSNGGYGPYFGTSEHYLDLDYCYVDFKNKYSSNTSKNPADYTVPDRVIKYNSSSLMRGDDVAWVQAVLYQLGLIAGVDGVFTPITKNAVINFQRRYGLDPDGSVGPMTRAMLIDINNHLGFSAAVKFNPDNTKPVDPVSSLGYAIPLTVGNGVKYTKKGFNLTGWTLQRASDKKFLCTNGKWYSEKTIQGGKYFKKLFANGSSFSINESMINPNSPDSEVYTFTAQWETHPLPKYTTYYNGYVYNTYYSELGYEDAKAFCASKGGSLATVADSAELRSIKLPDSEDKFYVGAEGDENGYTWLNGKKVTLPVDSSNGDGYLTVSYSSRSKPYTLPAVNADETVSGFIMKTKCPHDNTDITGYKSTLCDKDGYSGDRVCTDCKAVIEKGVTIPAGGHTYGAYTVTEPATCKDTGLKEKTCRVCGYVYSKTIPITDNHTFKTTVSKKATTKENGVATDKCTVCGLTNKNYTVRRIKSAKLKQTTYTYNGEKRKPKATVIDSKGNVLKPDIDYKITYVGYSRVGTAQAKITFRGKYEGQVIRTFKILPQKTSFTSVSAGRKTVTLKWKKITSQISGYQVQHSTSPDFTKNLVSSRLTGSKSVTKVFKNLRSGRKLYFRVRTFKTVDGKNYYSDWSKTTSRTIK